MRTFVIQSNRGVEQLVARRAHNPEAGGSSPSPATKKTDVEKSASVCRRMCAETGEMFHARYLVRVPELRLLRLSSGRRHIGFCNGLIFNEL